MDQLKAGVATALQTQFPDHPFSADKIKVMHRGRFANAVLFRYRDERHDLVVKDYSHCPPFFRNLSGPAFINREERVLKNLKKVSGVGRPFLRLNKAMLAYPYISGSSLSALRKRREKLPKEFFRKMEKMVWKMHRQGFVHLDLRNLGNILCSSDDLPNFIDFQSAVPLAKAPRWLRPLLRATDYSGVYKAWRVLCDEPLPPRKLQLLESYNRVRRFWVFKGYQIAQFKRSAPST